MEPHEAVQTAATVMIAAPSWMPTAFMAMVGWLITWGAWVSFMIMAAKGSTLTRIEHTTICEKKDRELNARLDKLDTSISVRFDASTTALSTAVNAITKTLEKQDLVATESRHTLNNKLQEIILTVALMNDRQQKAQQQIPQVSQDHPHRGTPR